MHHRPIKNYMHRYPRNQLPRNTLILRLATAFSVLKRSILKMASKITINAFTPGTSRISALLARTSSKPRPHCGCTEGLGHLISNIFSDSSPVRKLINHVRRRGWLIFLGEAKDKVAATLHLKDNSIQARLIATFACYASGY